MKYTPTTDKFHNTIHLVDQTTPVQGGTPVFDTQGNPIKGASNASRVQLADNIAYLKKGLETATTDLREGVSKAVFSFPTLALAQAAASTLPSGQVVTVRADSSKGGQDAVYTVQAGALQFEYFARPVRFADVATMAAWTTAPAGTVGTAESYLAGKKRGGGTFVFNPATASVNDGVFCFNGWERQLEFLEYTPYMAGCVGDGVTDDCQNLDKLMYALELNKWGGEVVFEGKFFINSEPPQVGGIIDHIGFGERIGVRLVANVKMKIPGGSVIKFGNHFDGGRTMLFCGIHRPDPNVWHPNITLDNIEFYGGGTVDLTETGIVTAQEGRRYVMNLSVKAFRLHDIKFIGGDFANVAIFQRWSRDYKVYDCVFDTNYQDDSFSDDHTTIYCIGHVADVYNNTFIMNNVKGKLFSCACELHGSYQTFHDNRVINYNTMMLFPMLRTDPMLDANYTVYGSSAYDNYAEIRESAFALFCILESSLVANGNAKLHSLRFYNNDILVIKNVTVEEYNEAGVRGVLFPASRNAMLFNNYIEGTNDLGTKVYPEVIDGIYVYGNKFRLQTEALIGYDNIFAIYQNMVNTKNLKVFDNDLQVMQFLAWNVDTSTPECFIEGWEIYGNKIDPRYVTTGTQVSLSLQKVNNCRFEFEVQSKFQTGVPFMWLGIREPEASFGNVFKVINTQATYGRVGIDGLANYPQGFFEYNRVEYSFKTDAVIQKGTTEGIYRLSVTNPDAPRYFSRADLRLIKGAFGLRLSFPDFLTQDYTGDTKMVAPVMGYNFSYSAETLASRPLTLFLTVRS